MDGRLENLLGALTLAVEDRLRPATEAVVGQRGSAAAALVHLASYGGESVEALSRVLGISQPGAVAVVERLVVAGLLERGPGADRRTHALTVTTEGRATVDRVLAARRRVLADLLSPLDDARRTQLADALEDVVAGLAHDRPQARTACRLCDRRACVGDPGDPVGPDGSGCPLEHTVAR